MATLHGISYVMCSGAGGKPLIHTDRALGAASGHSLFFGYDGMLLDYFTTAELFYYYRQETGCGQWLSKAHFP